MEENLPEMPGSPLYSVDGGPPKKMGELVVELQWVLDSGFGWPATITRVDTGAEVVVVTTDVVNWVDGVFTVPHRWPRLYPNQTVSLPRPDSGPWVGMLLIAADPSDPRQGDAIFSLRWAELATMSGQLSGFWERGEESVISKAARRRLIDMAAGKDTLSRQLVQTALRQIGAGSYWLAT